MDIYTIFKFSDLIRAKIDSSYNEIRTLINQLNDDDYTVMLNDANSLLSQARQKMYDFDIYVENKNIPELKLKQI